MNSALTIPSHNTIPKFTVADSNDPILQFLTPFDRKYVFDVANDLQQRIANRNLIPYMLSTTYCESKDFPLSAASAWASVISSVE